MPVVDFAPPRLATCVEVNESLRWLVLVASLSGCVDIPERNFGRADGGPIDPDVATGDTASGDGALQRDGPRDSRPDDGRARDGSTPDAAERPDAGPSDARVPDVLADGPQDAQSDARDARVPDLALDGALEPDAGTDGLVQDVVAPEPDVELDGPPLDRPLLPDGPPDGPTDDDATPGDANVELDVPGAPADAEAVVPAVWPLECPSRAPWPRLSTVWVATDEALIATRTDEELGQVLRTWALPGVTSLALLPDAVRAFASHAAGMTRLHLEAESIIGEPVEHAASEVGVSADGRYGVYLANRSIVGVIDLDDGARVPQPSGFVGVLPLPEPSSGPVVAANSRVYFGTEAGVALEYEDLPDLQRARRLEVCPGANGVGHIALTGDQSQLVMAIADQVGWTTLGQLPEVSCRRFQGEVFEGRFLALTAVPSTPSHMVTALLKQGRDPLEPTRLEVSRFDVQSDEILWREVIREVEVGDVFPGTLQLAVSDDDVVVIAVPGSPP